MLDLVAAMLMTTNVAVGEIPKPPTARVVEVRVGCTDEDPHAYVEQEVGPLIVSRHDNVRTNIIHHLYMSEEGQFAVIVETPNGLWCSLVATGDE